MAKKEYSPKRKRLHKVAYRATIVISFIVWPIYFNQTYDGRIWFEMIGAGIYGIIRIWVIYLLIRFLGFRILFWVFEGFINSSEEE